MAIILGILRCFAKYFVFLIPVVIILVLLHIYCKMPKELFRKLLHIPGFLSAPVIVYVADTWYIAVLTILIFEAIVYPALTVFERWSGYADLFVQRSPGEVKNSLILLCSADALFIAIYWGLFNKPYIVVVGIIMWGVGDGMAALIGKRFGKHHVSLPLADQKKTWEGSIAMFLASAVTGIILLKVMTDFEMDYVIMTALITAIGGAYTELITHSGNDTVTVPLVNTIVLFLFEIL